jgi:hypothetical protein
MNKFAFKSGKSGGGDSEMVVSSEQNRQTMSDLDWITF